MCFQVGPKALSVFGYRSRTNNLVESHNARLATKLGKRAPFYRFVLALRKEELRKSIQFLQVQADEQSVFEKPKEKYVMRSKQIERAQNKLKPGTESLKEFLNAVTKNAIKGFSSYEPNLGEEEIIDEDFDDQRDCYECRKSRRQVMFNACNHLLLCFACFTNKQLMEVDLKCPLCNEPVTNNYTLY